MGKGIAGGFFCRRAILACAMGAAFVVASMGALGQSIKTGAKMEQKPLEARILVMGDSLSAEYGIARGQGWVALMEARAKQMGKLAVFFNASISGETSAGGRGRLGKELEKAKPSLVVIELGCNDALQGQKIEAAKMNLEAMIQASQKAGASVVLVGMQMPPNYGKKYVESFNEMYKSLSIQYHAKLVPFMFAGVADVPDAREYFQADGLHPLAKAHTKILNNIWPQVAAATGW